jgi:transcriptional regulator with XRE-family HTH domain
MEAMERDPAYIAQKVKFLRKWAKLTQENVADIAGLTTRTIEKIESGRHRPEEQTLRSLARAFQINVAHFEKPTPEQEAKERADIARAARKTVVCPTDPVRTASEFLSAFDHRHVFRFNAPAQQSDQLLQVTASMFDWVQGLNDVWEDCSMSQRLEYARSFAEFCHQLEALGYLCHMGHHRQALYEKGRPALVLVVGLMCIRKKEEAEGRRYALVELDGRWETVKEERIPLPEGYGA